MRKNKEKRKHTNTEKTEKNRMQHVRAPLGLMIF